MDELVAWLREQVEAILALPWHLPECQMLKPVPDELARAMPLMAGGFSCNCALVSHMYAQYEAHTAILDRCERVRENYASDDFTAYYLARDMMRMLALSYRHRPGYREEWRP